MRHKWRILRKGEKKIQKFYLDITSFYRKLFTYKRRQNKSFIQAQFNCLREMSLYRYKYKYIQAFDFFRESDKKYININFFLFLLKYILIFLSIFALFVVAVAVFALFLVTGNWDITMFLKYLYLFLYCFCFFKKIKEKNDDKLNILSDFMNKHKREMCARQKWA